MNRLMELYIKVHGHRCNRFAPFTCCPCAHGAPIEQCNCFSEEEQEKTYWPEHEGWNPPGPQYF